MIYYGDEQGFTGTGGDQLARQTMFASKVADYLDDDLLGTDRTHAQDNFNPSHPLYELIRQLASSHQSPSGTAQRRPPGSLRKRRSRDLRLLPASTASSNASTWWRSITASPTKTGPSRPTSPTADFVKVYGSGPEQLTTNDNRLLTVTVPALSTVVYRIGKPDPAIRCSAADLAGEARGRRPRRIHGCSVSATVGGSSFNEVTFYARVGNDDWKSIGTDDTRPYRVFHDVSSIPDRKQVTYRAVVRDNAGHQRLSGSATAHSFRRPS